MSISEGVRKIKRVLSGDLYVVLLMVLVGTASFGLGRLSATEDARDPVRIVSDSDSGEVLGGNVSAAVGTGGSATDEALAGQYVGSKNSDKYHFPWCPGAARIKEENKVWFATRADAERAGYVPAANCKGL